MLALLDQWRRQGGSRLDRTGNGQITAPGRGDHGHGLAAAGQRMGPSVLGRSADQPAGLVLTSIYDQPPGGQ